VLNPISGPLVFPQQRLAILNTAAARGLLMPGGTIVAQLPLETGSAAEGDPAKKINRFCLGRRWIIVDRIGRHQRLITVPNLKYCQTAAKRIRIPELSIRRPVLRNYSREKRDE